jgi:hypothetical protein
MRLGAAGAFFFVAWLSIGFVSVFAGTIAGGSWLIGRTFQSIAICSPLSRGN